MTEETKFTAFTPDHPDTGDQKPTLEIKQNRFAYRAYLFLLVMFTLLSGLLIFQGVSENTMGNPDQIINVSLLVFLVLSLGIGLYQIRNGKTTNGVWAFFIAMWVVAIGTTLVMTDSSGLFLDNMRGLFGLLVVIPLAWNTLPIKQRNRAIVIQVFMSVLTFALVLYKRQTMPDVPADSNSITSLMSIIMAVMIVGILYYVARAFPTGLQYFLNLSVRTKLIAVIVGLSLVAVITLFAVNISDTREILIAQETEKLLSLSQQRANEFTEMLTGRLAAMKAYALAVEEDEIFVAQNESYSGSLSAIEAQILRLDDQWINASDTNSLVQGVLGNELSAETEHYMETFDVYFIEVFITDRYGANVAAVDRTSDYYQADEGWWQSAYNNGKGAVYIGEAEYDESAEVWGFNMAVPIYSHETGEVLGIMRTTALFDQFLAKLGEGLSETAGVQISFPSGVAIAPDGSIGNFSEEHMTEHQFSETAEFAIEVEEGESLYTATAFLFSEDNPDIENAGWRLFIHDNEATVLAPVRQQTQTSVLLAIGVSVLVSVIAAFLANTIANPIVKLTDMASQFASGNYEVRSDVTSSDEIGKLSETFNAMADEVGARTIELQERSREMEASQRVTFAASERTTPDDFLNLLVNLIADQFDVYHVQVYLVDENKTKAVLAQSTGFAGRQLLQRGHNISLDQASLVTRSINTGEPVLVGDTTVDPDWLPNPLLPLTQSELVVPLKVEGTIIGALDIQDRVANRFTDQTVPVFATMTEHVASLFQTTELLDEIESRTDDLEKFATQLRSSAEIAGKLNSITDIEQLLEEAVNQLQTQVGFYHAHIYLLDENKENLVVQAGSGHVGQTLKRTKHTIPVDREASLVARAARNVDVVVVSDVRAEEGFMTNPLLPNTRSEVAIPLITGESLIGVLDLQDEQVDRFTPADVDTLTTLSGQMASSIESAELFGRVEQERAHTELLYDISNELNIPQNA